MIRKLAGVFGSLAAAVGIMAMAASYAHDAEHPVSDSMKSWFMGLHSGKGPCCADADGHVVADVDWQSKDGHYQVQLGGKWLDVPDDAVLTTPNLYGRAMVWPMNPWDETWGVESGIRCFMPGPEG